MLSKFKRIIAKPHIAIDLGTANTRIYTCELGMLDEEPSLVPNIDKMTNAHNSDAYIAYLNSKFVSSPLSGGVIVDVHKTIELLKPFFKRTRTGLRRPVSLACAPTDTSENERKLLAEAVLHAGSSHVAIIPEPWAAAIGAGIDVTLPYAQLLIDIGEGVTDLAVIREGQLIYTSALRTACYDLHKAVRSSVISRHRVYLYPEEVERLTHQIDTSLQAQALPDKPIAARGVDIVRRSEVSIEVSNRGIISAMEPIIYKILKMIEVSLQKLPESVSAQVFESGICLTGGGSCIKGVERLIASRTNLNVRIASDPVHAVINGAIQTLQYWKERESWWDNVFWPIHGTPNYG